MYNNPGTNKSHWNFFDNDQPEALEPATRLGFRVAQLMIPLFKKTLKDIILILKTGCREREVPAHHSALLSLLSVMFWG